MRFVTCSLKRKFLIVGGGERGVDCNKVPFCKTIIVVVFEGVVVVVAVTTFGRRDSIDEITVEDFLVSAADDGDDGDDDDELDG
jgi:hypothetical protein